MLIIKNAEVYSPQKLGKKDILIANGKIQAIEDSIDLKADYISSWDAKGKTLLPGFIDQHVHVTGAGGKHGFSSMSPELKLTQLLEVGTTTVVGLLGTDGSTRSIKGLYAKVKALNTEGMTAYMYTGYYGMDPVHLTESIQDDMIFIDKVLGCKIAITDVRSDYPSALDLVRRLRQVRVGGMIGEKKGILHLHLGNLSSKMDLLFEIVKDYEFPIEHISPTHVGRTKPLFDEAIKFAKMGGMIDITTGASQYDKPYKSVLYALEEGVSIDKMTFSSDGNAGLEKKDANGKMIGFRAAPIDQNFAQCVDLVKQGGLPIEEAFKPITINPAINLGLKQKGRVEVGADADFCVLNDDLELQAVFAKGKQMMKEGQLTVKNAFE
jgi:beta-aspartyl-dipeptidase (metallo-type)